MSYTGLRTDWYTDGLVPTTAYVEHVPTSPRHGTAPLSQTYKHELCVGIVTRSATYTRRIYRAALPADYLTSTGEIQTAALAFMSASDSVLHFGWHQVNVSIVRQDWESVLATTYQGELMTHNHRKVHVPFDAVGVIPG